MMKKKNKKINSVINFIKDKSLIILISLLVIISLILLIVWLLNINNLKTDDKLVTELHNYFSTDDLGNCEGLFIYSKDKIEYKDINSETRLCLAYQKTEIKNAELETLKADKKKDICTLENMTFKKDEETNTCSVSKIRKDVINETYKKLYGKDIEANEAFKIDNLNICYLKDDFYYCGLSETFTYTLGSESTIYRVIKKAVEKSSEIIIYDYFLKINEDTCYENYTTTATIQKCTDKYKKKKDVNYKLLKKYGTEYKHVFKKSKDDSYYWVSSEPIK